MQFAKVAVAFVPLQLLYGATASQIGLVLSTVGLVGLVMGVTMGLFAQAIGYRRLLLGGLGLGALLSALQSSLPPFPLLLASRVLEGASHLAVVVAAPTLISAATAVSHRSIAMGLWSTFVGVAFAITAAVGDALIGRVGVGGLLLAHAGALACAGALVWFLVPRESGTPTRHRGPPLRTLARQHMAVYAAFDTALPGLCFLCYAIVAIALLTFIPQHAGPDAAWLAVVLPLMTIAGNFCAGWLAQHWLAPLQLARAAFIALGASALLVWWSHHGGASIAPAALVLMLSAGVAGGAGFALIPFLCHDSASQARANGAVAQLGNVGSTSGPPLLAALSTSMGVAGLVLPVLAFASLAVALATWAARHHARRGAV